MAGRYQPILRTIGIVLALLLLTGAAALFLPQIRQHFASAGETRAGEKEDPAGEMKLVAGEPGMLSVPADVIRNLRVETSVAEAARSGATLNLSGTLMYDTNRLSHVHTRFAGEITEIGSTGPDASGPSRPIDFGESVRKDQLLCVLWCRDLGEKKSELVDNLSQLHVDKETLDRLVESSREGAIPERTIREARRRVETDDIAVARCIRTLQSWRIAEKEIEAVRAEAERYYTSKDRTREELVHEWARVEVRAPLDGVVVERNAVLGELVDTNIDLFIIADFSRLRVAAHAYEEDLPKLDLLRPQERRWTIRAPADPAADLHAGGFDKIGRVIDPNQHTALVMGWVPNADNCLRVGQFVTAEIPLPCPQNEVAIPASALVEQGNQKMVLVEVDPQQHRYARRQIVMTRRSATTVYAATEVTPEQQRQGLQPLAAGQRVVSSGAVPLLTKLGMLESTPVAAQ